MNEFLKTLRQGVQCKCPSCLKGHLYKTRFDLAVSSTCPECGLDLTKSDSADGPAVFLIFLLGFLLVPSALLVDHIFEPPVIVHIILWTAVTFGLCVGLLKPLKSYIIFLQFKYRQSDWD